MKLKLENIDYSNCLQVNAYDYNHGDVVTFELSYDDIALANVMDLEISVTLTHQGYDEFDIEMFDYNLISLIDENGVFEPILSEDQQESILNTIHQEFIY